MTLTLLSPNFEHYAAMPAQFTCDGQNRSSELIWSEVPAGARSLALIIDDPEAPDDLGTLGTLQSPTQQYRLA